MQMSPRLELIDHLYTQVSLTVGSIVFCRLYMSKHMQLATISNSEPWSMTLV